MASASERPHHQVMAANVSAAGTVADQRPMLMAEGRHWRRLPPRLPNMPEASSTIATMIIAKIRNGR